jgi:hypothetical protein
MGKAEENNENPYSGVPNSKERFEPIFSKNFGKSKRQKL